MTDKVTFPQIGNYNLAFERVFNQGMGLEYVSPPKMTDRTLALGTKYSPDSVCAPFKFMLGNYIEAIQKGAKILVGVGGVCRLGYYGELHEQILKDLGYNVKFVNFARARLKKPKTWHDKFKDLNPDMSLVRIGEVLPTAIRMIKYMDQVDDYLRKNLGFEQEEGAFMALYQDYLAGLREIEGLKDLKTYQKAAMKDFQKIPLDKPKNPLKVALVGEYYTVMEPFSNHFLEKWLAKRGVEVSRWMNLTNSLIDRPEKKVKNHIKHYASYNMGATSMYTIATALKCAKKNFDGIIHIKSAGCMPEIDTMTVLQNISKDYQIPILYLSFDSQTSDLGLETRLEAFYDMILMRKEKLF